MKTAATYSALAASILYSTVMALGQAHSFRQPIPWQQLPAKLRPARNRPDLAGRHSQNERNKALQAQQAGTLQTLPFWQGSFSVKSKEYTYTILGGDPSQGGTTTLSTVIVPIQLTFPEFSEDGTNPVVLDATSSVRDILNSPIFRRSDYISGKLQFMDGMLHAEFPQAATDWHTLLSPSVAPTLEITVPSGKAKIFKSQSGKLLAEITHDAVLDDPIFNLVGGETFPPDQFIIFVTYNTLEHDAFGYHDAVFREQKTQESVFAYTSWLEDVNDLFFIPSPDTATMSHEVAESVHDAFLGNLASKTLLWGDAFFHNECFQDFIEVGDAVEDAPGPIQLHEQVVGFDRNARVYTLQNEATLQWFERKDPSDALAATYSFPDIWVLKKPAPLTCVP